MPPLTYYIFVDKQNEYITIQIKAYDLEEAERRLRDIVVDEERFEHVSK